MGYKARSALHLQLKIHPGLFPVLLKSIPGEIFPLSSVCLCVCQVFHYMLLHMAPSTVKPLVAAMTLPVLVNWIFFLLHGFIMCCLPFTNFTSRDI